jgi:hypothetical protein
MTLGMTVVTVINGVEERDHGGFPGAFPWDSVGRLSVLMASSYGLIPVVGVETKLRVWCKTFLDTKWEVNRG